MNRIILFLLFLCSLFHTEKTLGQLQNPSSWTYTFAKEQVAKGETVDLIFTATLQNDWYLYSTEFEAEGPLPTTFTFQPHPSFAIVGKPKPINPKEKYDEIWQGKVRYFDNRAVFKQTVKILAENPVIKGASSFQTCRHTNGLCVAGDLDFEFKGIKVTEGGTQTSPTVDPKVLNTTDSATVDASASPERDSSTIVTADTIAKVAAEPIQTEGTSEDKSIWGFALAAFLSGLVALLTPCVFPIIPMTVSYFTHQENGRVKAILYGVSIILIYTLIGTVLSRINGPAFANFLSTHWLPNLLFFAIFFVFALSFLGLFEIVLPSNLVNQMDARADRGGYAGVFFMAFTLVLVSFSCTGPIVGSLLVASAGGEVVKPIIGMAAFSSAFAIPFTLFALFPQWLKSLPKSGGWLNTVKVVLGFLELALALKFLSIADQVYHWNLLDREVFLAFWIAIFGMLGLYLLGKIRTPHDSVLEKVSVPRLLLSLLTFTFVIYMIPGMWGAPLKALAGYLPPQSTIDFDLSKRTGGIAKTTSGEPKKYANLFHLPHGLDGFFHYQDALDYAKKVNKPVFIDFTGHGCVNCREMEARVWSDPEVLKRLENDFVIVALYVDDKTELPQSSWYTSSYDNKVKKTIGAQNGDLQIVKYNNNAQPHYCIVDHEGNLLVTPINYDLDAGRFASYLDKGKAAFQAK